MESGEPNIEWPGIQSEWLLPRPPYDEGADTLAGHARRKLEQGTVRRQIALWPERP